MSSMEFYKITPNEIIPGLIITDQPESTGALQEAATEATTPFILLKVKPGKVVFEKAEIIKWARFASEKRAALCYTGYYENKRGEKNIVPTIEYQKGSIRDDFNFGPLVLINSSLLKQYFTNHHENYCFAGWYDLRLYLSREGKVARYTGFMYQYEEDDFRISSEKQFDYVDPRNRERQIEMEKAATFHLEKINARLYPPFKTINISEGEFKTGASVIIPVLNREKTIADAIYSALKQETSFPFNIIVVNNHSTDKTGAIIDGTSDERVIHYIPKKINLGIGGCWNEGINHPLCGRFAVQLDSDDLYSDGHSLQRIINTFYNEKCAMVIGSYEMVNFGLKPIPPGLIDHREWTPENGPNNALRINGLGAPRAFFTPVIRKIGFPNVSYGEDYAVALAISRKYKIGRIYEPVYLCRRWNDNTDTNLNIEKINENNKFKDSFRSIEIEKRKRIKETPSKKVVL